MRSSPAPGTWISRSRFAAFAMSRVNAIVTSTSTSGIRDTTLFSSASVISHGVASRARTLGSRLAANVPQIATRSMEHLPGAAPAYVADTSRSIPCEGIGRRLRIGPGRPVAEDTGGLLVFREEAFDA